MTLETFLERLEQTPRDWVLRGRTIRCGTLEEPMCPLSYFSGDASWCYPIAAKELGLAEELSEQIAEAADTKSGHDKQLRAKLLKACGLAAA